MLIKQYRSSNGFKVEEAGTWRFSLFLEQSNPYTGGTPWMRCVIDGVASNSAGYYPGTEQVFIAEGGELASQYAPNPLDTSKI